MTMFLFNDMILYDNRLMTESSNYSRVYECTPNFLFYFFEFIDSPSQGILKRASIIVCRLHCIHSPSGTNILNKHEYELYPPI